MYMKIFLKISAFAFLCFCALALPVHSGEIHTRFAQIQYDSREALKDFNYALYMGRLRRQVRDGDTIEDEVGAKIDFIVGKVMQVLDMYQHELKFKIMIRSLPKQVHADFKRLYNVDVKYIAFYSPGQNTVFFSAKKAKLSVVAHELGHVVAENYFDVSPPPKIHEILAQYAEKHITD